MASVPAAIIFPDGAIRTEYFYHKPKQRDIGQPKPLYVKTQSIPYTKTRRPREYYRFLEGPKKGKFAKKAEAEAYLDLNVLTTIDLFWHVKARYRGSSKLIDETQKMRFETGEYIPEYAVEKWIRDNQRMIESLRLGQGWDYDKKKPLRPIAQMIDGEITLLRAKAYTRSI